MGLNMTSGGGFYYIVGYGEEIRILAVDVIITEKNIIGNLVGTWSELYELMELANKGLVKLSMQEYITQTTFPLNFLLCFFLK